MIPVQTEDAPKILDAAGRPMPKRGGEDCPRCRAGKDKRVASSGFGSPHDVCSRCGHEFHGESTV